MENKSANKDNSMAELVLKILFSAVQVGVVVTVIFYILRLAFSEPGA